MSFMSILTTFQEYDDGALTQKYEWFNAQYPNHRFTMEELDNEIGIHVFNRFEEEGFEEHFQCHFRFVDITRDAFYALAMLVTLE